MAPTNFQVNETEQRKYELLQWLCSVSRMKVYKGKSIAELTEYQGISLWEVSLLSTFNSLLQKQNHRGLSKAVRIKRNILLSLFGFLEPAGSLVSRELSKLFYVLQFKKNKKAKHTALIISTDRSWCENFDNDNNSIKKQDIDFNQILVELSALKDIRTLTVLPIGQLRSPKNILAHLERAMYQKAMHMPFERYWSYDVYKKQKQAKDYFNNLWEGLLKEKKFAEIFNYDEKNSFLAIKEVIEPYFKYHFSNLVKYLEISNNLFKKEKPDVIIALTVQVSPQLMTILAAKKNKIPVILICRGLSPTNNFELFYRFGKLPNLPQSLYLHGIYALSGPWIKENLMKNCKVPEEDIIVTGQPRYDQLVKFRDKFDKEAFLNLHNIDEHKKIVVVSTYYPILAIEERKKLIRDLLDELKKINEIAVIIKPHPLESQKFYDDIIESKKYDALVMSERSNITELLLASDLMIGTSSTTLLEASILNKPVLVLNLSNIGFNRLWASISSPENGALQYIFKKEEIQPKVREILFDKKIQEKMERARKKFVYDLAYLQDGKATERVIDLAMQLMGKKKWAKINL